MWPRIYIGDSRFGAYIGTGVLFRGQNYGVRRSGTSKRRHGKDAGTGSVSAGLTLFRKNRVYYPAQISLGACLNFSVTRTTGINPEPGFLENNETCSSNQNNYSKKCCRV